MISVCHVTTVHSRYDVRIFEKECISLAELGYNVTLIVNDQEALGSLIFRCSPKN